MWIPAGIVYIIAGLAFFAGWLREFERRVQLRDARARGLQPGEASCWTGRGTRIDTTLHECTRIGPRLQPTCPRFAQLNAPFGFA